jgi:hypothetical protein
MYARGCSVGTQYDKRILYWLMNNFILIFQYELGGFWPKFFMCLEEDHHLFSRLGCSTKACIRFQITN